MKNISITDDNLSKLEIIKIVCEKPVTITKVLGGGEDWYYAVCECGKFLDVSHENDKQRMIRLRGIKKHDEFINIYKK